MNKVTLLRHLLHRNAELSGSEINTAKILYKLLFDLNPELLLQNVGGHGLIAVFDSKVQGPNIMFRAEIDALPINEFTDLTYKSTNVGVSHKCGHDGHSSILYGFAEYISNNRPHRGKVILLFQPAEETGTGAENIIMELGELKIDYAFALHNLPGYPLNSIVIRYNTFACASIGISISLHGLNAHASEPEKGVSPAKALASLIEELPLIAHSDVIDENYSLLTIVHASLGREAFGISPGDAKIMITVRAATDELLMQQMNNIEDIVSRLAIANQLRYNINYSDKFPAMVNDTEATDIIMAAAKLGNYQLIKNEFPFRWSEDFSYFSKICKSALFGIGAGKEHLPLHNPDYDFPDEIIPTAIDMWKSILKIVNNI